MKLALISSLSGSKLGESLGLSRFWMGLVFVLTLALSIFYNLPASWLISQPVVQKQIPKQWLIETVEGSVWNGEMAISTHITNKPGTVLDLGILEWDVDWLPLLKASLGSQQQWFLAENSQIGFYFERDLLSAEAPVILTGLQGSVDIAQLTQRLASAGLGMFAATGQIIARDVEMALNSLTFWPEKVSGQFEIHSLSTFGINLPVVTVVPSMEAQAILLDLNAQEDGWRLIGHVDIRPNHTYDVTISVKAESAQKMPAWAQIMVQKTPTLAAFTSKGRW